MEKHDKGKKVSFRELFSNSKRPKRKAAPTSTIRKSPRIEAVPISAKTAPPRGDVCASCERDIDLMKDLHCMCGLKYREEDLPNYSKCFFLHRECLMKLDPTRAPKEEVWYCAICAEDCDEHVTFPPTKHMKSYLENVETPKDRRPATTPKAASTPTSASTSARASDIVDHEEEEEEEENEITAPKKKQSPVAKIKAKSQKKKGGKGQPGGGRGRPNARTYREIYELLSVAKKNNGSPSTFPEGVVTDLHLAGCFVDKDADVDGWKYLKNLFNTLKRANCPQLKEFKPRSDTNVEDERGWFEKSKDLVAQLKGSDILFDSQADLETEEEYQQRLAESRQKRVSARKNASNQLLHAIHSDSYSRNSLNHAIRGRNSSMAALDGLIWDTLTAVMLDVNPAYVVPQKPSFFVSLGDTQDASTQCEVEASESTVADTQNEYSTDFEESMEHMNDDEFLQSDAQGEHD
jgi:hypothetical protein